MKLCILVADDDEPSRRLVRRLMERAGCTVLEAKDGIVALQMLDDHHVDLIILDQKMPKLWGTEVVKQIRQQPFTASLPVVMLTASADSHTAQLAIDAGCDLIKTKPFEVSTFAAEVIGMVACSGT